jgi:hypothetical protein
MSLCRLFLRERLTPFRRPSPKSRRAVVRVDADPALCSATLWDLIVFIITEGDYRPA